MCATLAVKIIQQNDVLIFLATGNFRQDLFNVECIFALLWLAVSLYQGGFCDWLTGFPICWCLRKGAQRFPRLFISRSFLRHNATTVAFAFG